MTTIMRGPICRALRDSGAGPARNCVDAISGIGFGAPSFDRTVFCARRSVLVKRTKLQRETFQCLCDAKPASKLHTTFIGAVS
jgi:hypothetical protein